MFDILKSLKEQFIRTLIFNFQALMPRIQNVIKPKLKQN